MHQLTLLPEWPGDGGPVKRGQQGEWRAPAGPSPPIAIPAGAEPQVGTVLLVTRKGTALGFSRLCSVWGSLPASPGEQGTDLFLSGCVSGPPARPSGAGAAGRRGDPGLLPPSQTASPA